MRDLIRAVGQILLSVPFFLKWPFVIWNWAARAHYIPTEQRNPLFSWCMAGFGIIGMGTFGMLLEPNILVFLNFFGPYIGAGLPAMRIGLRLSREYRHLREIKLLEHKPSPEHPQV